MSDDVDRLAVGFIEATTAWDFRDLPEHLQAKLRETAAAVIAHISPIVIRATPEQEALDE